MIRLRYLIGLIPLWLLSLTCIYSSWAADPPPDVLPSPGTYISARYLQGLRSTKSPFLAEGTRIVHALVVHSVDSTSAIVMATFNFHEGGPEFSVNRAGAVSTIVPTGTDPNSVVLKVKTSDRLGLGFDRSEYETFMKIDDFDGLLRAIVIAGRYRNRAGAIFEFTQAGTIITPQGSFPYLVGADHVSYRFDYIVDPQRHLFFKLIRHGCVIDLYALPDWQDGNGPTDGSGAKLWQSLRADGCQEPMEK